MDINELTGPASVNTAHIGPKWPSRKKCVGTARKCADGGRLNVIWALNDLRGRKHPQASMRSFGLFWTPRASSAPGPDLLLRRQFWGWPYTRSACFTRFHTQNSRFQTHPPHTLRFNLNSAGPWLQRGTLGSHNSAVRTQFPHQSPDLPSRAQVSKRETESVIVTEEKRSQSVILGLGYQFKRKRSQLIILGLSYGSGSGPAAAGERWGPRKNLGNKKGEKKGVREREQEWGSIGCHC